MKNTDKNYKIVNRHLGKKVALMAGVSVSAMLLALMNSQKNNVCERDAYHKIYSDIYESLDMDSFDSKFIDLYKNATININGKKLPLEKLRIRHTESGVTHFILSGDNNTDVYTGERFNDIDDKIDFICPFRDSTMFYQMYLDGLLQSNDITISNKIIQKYASDWNKETHTAIPRLKAEEETKKIYRMKR